MPATAVVAADDLVYAAAPGGIGHSADGGSTWNFVKLPEPAPLVSCLTIAANVVLAGTMQDGALISDDGGASWQARNAGLFDPDVRAIAVSPSFAADRTVFAATSTGLFRSCNAGRLWRPFGDLPDHAPVSAMRILTDGVLIAGLEDAGLWRSTDAGAHWSGSPTTRSRKISK